SINIAFGVNGRAANSATLNTPQGNTTLFTNTYNPESILTTSKNSLNVTESQSPNPALGLSSVTNGNSQPMHSFTPDTNLRTVDYRIGTGSNAVGIKTTSNEIGNAVSTKQTLPTTADIGTSSYRADDPDMLDSSLSSNASTFASNFNTSYTYDAFGRIWTATSVGTGTGANVTTPAPYSVMHTYTYDDEDHILTDNNITYTYYGSGLLKTMTVRDGLGNYVRYTYTYDSKLRTYLILAERVNNSAGDVVLQSLTSATYMYDDSDRVTYVWTAFGVTKYVYDSESRISELYNLRPDSNGQQIPVDLPGGGTSYRGVLSSFTNITYDKQSNRTGMTIALATSSGNPTVYKSGTATFGYDDASRLISEIWSGNIVGTTVSYTHSYDNADNLITLRSSGLTVDTTSDLLTSLGYSFNSFGDCESWKNTAVNGSPLTLSASLGWDPAGQLTRVAGPSAVTNSFNSNVTEQMAYDDQGRRVSSRVYGYQFQSSGPTFYADSYTYSGSDLVMRTSLGTITVLGGNTFTVGNDFSQKNTVFYLNGPTGPVSEFDVDGNVADLTYDPQGSCIASNSGPLPKWMLYDAYGKPVARHPNMTFDDASRAVLNQPLQYKGQYGYIADAHTGAYYCTHRFYDPNSGRWLSRDPIGLEGGTNTFAYCSGNPVMGVDPSGLQEMAMAMAPYSFYHPMPGSHTATPPSFWESLIPIYGAQRAMDYAASEGDGWGVLWGATSLLLDFCPGSIAGKVATKGKTAYQVLKVAKKMNSVRKLGKAGESIVAAVIEIGPKTRYIINGRTRIADGINKALHTYSEVKNVAELSKTQQIVDGIQYARANNLSYNLFVRKGTTFTGPLELLEKTGQILVHRIL
ncbi:MAG: RHS repeat-associated core domain-containing protein, partial [Armatimonadota bacterium]